MAVIEVVKYNGSSDVFAWKYPSEELGTWTQLGVNESQEAILYKGGQALDLFGPGRRTLETANIPFLNKIVNLPFGGRSPFAAEVWYINKTHILDIKWGTPSPIQLQDPKYKVFTPLRSFGQFGIQIIDTKLFLTKLVATLSTFDKNSLINYFRGLYLTKVKDAISSYLIQQNVSALEINAYLNELSEYLQEKLAPILEEYCIKLVNFFVNDINIPEDDPAVRKLKDALAKKAEMDIIGYSYVQERSFDTLEGAANNPGGGQSGLMGAGIGLGMGVGIGGSMGNSMGDITKNINTSEMKKCLKCGLDMEITQRFCPSCGDDSQKSQENSNKSQITACSKCGKEYPKTSKFCPECGDSYTPCFFCGEDMKEEATACSKCGKSAPQTCPKCNTLITNDQAKFCPECGKKL